MLVSRDKFLVFYIGIISFFPLLPPIFQRNEQIINILALLLSLYAIWSFRLKLNLSQRIYLFSYFFIFQFSLMLSFWFGIDPMGGYSDILSYHRPIMLFLMVLGLYVLTANLNFTYLKLISLFKLIVVVVFVYSLLEVFFLDTFSGLMHTLYRIEDKSNIDGIAVSFFTLPYYASYILLIILPFLISFRYLSQNNKDNKYIFFCLMSIILTQSKMGIILAIGVIFFYVFLSVSLTKKLIVLTIFSVFIVLISLFIVDFVSYLNSEFGGNFAHTMYVMLTNTENSGNLTERLLDITETYSAVMLNNPFVGLGLGKGKTIEIWIGSILYRYGFISLIFFILFFLFTGLKAVAMVSKQKKIWPIKAEFLKIIAIWSFTLYISQLSSFMFEMSKAGVFSMLMFALCVRVLFNNNCESKSDTSYS